RMRRRARARAQEANGAAAIDEPDIGRRKSVAESARGFGVDRTGADARAAIHTNIGELCHSPGIASRETGVKQGWMRRRRLLSGGARQNTRTFQDFPAIPLDCR